MRVILLAASAALALCGCGGGGGGQGGSSLGEGSPVGLSVSRSAFEPTTIFAGQVEGFVFSVVVDRQPNPAKPRYTEPVHAVLSDAGSAMDPEHMGLEWNGNDNYSAGADTRANLPVGRYRGSLLVRLCPDAECRRVFTEKRVSYDITVAADSGDNRKTLEPFTNLGAWGQQPGYVPVTLDPARFSSRWLWTVQEPVDHARLSAPLSDAATGMGYVLTSKQDGTRRLIAFREDDHSEVWSKDLSGQMLGGPTLSGGRLWFSKAVGDRPHLMAYDAMSGALLFDTDVDPPMGMGTIVPTAPVVSGDAVFVNYGHNNGFSGRVLAFNAANGSYRWASLSGGGGSAGVSADENYVYYFRPNSNTSPREGFIALHRASGEQAFVHARPSRAGGTVVSYDGTTPLPDGKGGVLVGSGGTSSDPFLYRYDLTRMQPVWELAPLLDVLAVAGETLYVGNEGTPTLEAYRLADGVRQWQWNPPELRGTEYTFYSMLVTNNLIFISTNDQVYALDRTTRRQVWSYPLPGLLAISPSGLLYIVRLRDHAGGTSADGKLAAINLQ